MKRKIRHGAAVACDAPGCEATFTTYSVSSLARKQASEYAGFLRMKLGQMPGWESWGLGSKKTKKVDVCPGCKPKPRMEKAAV